MNIQTLTAADIAQGLRSGEFSAQEIVDASYALIEAAEEKVHAFVEFTRASAYAQAQVIDARIAAGKLDELGCLAGVPFALKDNMNMIGSHTTCSSRMLENYVSPYDATVTKRSLAEGALVLGKLNMDEFAFGSSTETSAFSKTYNPWDLERVPGGSSGGSAAAVAAGEVAISLGSDTGGSIRQPASFCGVIGLKPSYGTISRYGVVAFGSSLDQVGPFARTTKDIALAMNALAGKDPRDCTSQECKVDYLSALTHDVKGMHIGYVPSFMEAQGLEPEVKARVEEVLDKLEKAGAILQEVELPHARAAMSAYYVLGPCEAFSNLARFDAVRYGYCESAKNLEEQYELSRAHGFGAEARRRIMLGSYLLSSGVYERYYYPAQQIRTLIIEDYQQAFEQVEALVTPVAPRTAFKFGEITDPTAMYLSDMFTISINIAGNGGMSFPVGLGEETSLPVGVQLISPALRDENIIRIASVLEDIYGPAQIAPAFVRSDS